MTVSLVLPLNIALGSFLIYSHPISLSLNECTWMNVGIRKLTWMKLS